jgi:hypothetical protein
MRIEERATTRNVLCNVGRCPPYRPAPTQQMSVVLPELAEPNGWAPI